MASGARRPDENVSASMMPAPSTAERHIPDGGLQGYVSDAREPTDTIFAGLRSGSAAPNSWETGKGVSNYPDELYLPSSPLGSPPNVSPRPRSSSQPVPVPIQSKTVAFDLGSRTSSPEPLSNHPADHGYESDDSDSTLEHSDRDRSHYRRHRSNGRHHPSSSTYPPNPVPSTSKHHRSSKGSARDRYQSDSESTVDLPDRFDSADRHKRDDDPAEKIESLLNRFIGGGESKNRKRRSTRH